VLKRIIDSPATLAIDVSKKGHPMNLRTALLAAAASVAVIGTASAQNVTGFYVGGAAGLSIVDQIDGTYKPVGTKASQDYKSGYGLSGALGYGYSNGFRSEIEAAYSEANTKNTSYSLGNGITASTGGNANAFSLFGNALYDFNLGLPVTPYLGVGLGWLRLAAETKVNSTVGNIKLLDDSTDAIGYQLVAGLSLPIVDNLKATLDYRFKSSFNKPKFDTTAEARNLNANLRTYEADRPMIHNVFLGLRYEFGAPARPATAATPVQAPAPAPAPIAAPAPAPAPAAAPAAQIQRNFLVFFDFNESILTPEASRIIQQAATTARQGNVTRITATGHTDTSGSPQYNQRLSERRADAVRADLVRQGIPASQIVTIGRGESELRVRTADGVREPQNRRVEIVLQ
jgi:outer membrane protein OmpA-like peptidoglycan-associated protein